jgi:putative membrane protein
MDDMGGMGIWMLIWSLLSLGLLALVVVGVVWLVRSLVQSTSRSRPDAAEQELRRRYAAGQIDAEEFRRRVEELRRP